MKKSILLFIVGVGASLLLLKMWSKNGESSGPVQVIANPDQNSITSYQTNTDGLKLALQVQKHEEHKSSQEHHQTNYK